MSDLFAFFDALNKGDMDYVDSMTDKSVKDISPFVLTMWMSGATSNQVEHVILTDMYCNDKVFGLSKHPRLLLKLFISANSGMGNDRYKFERCVSKTESRAIHNIASYYRCGLHEARQYKELLSKDDIKEIEGIVGE